MQILLDFLTISHHKNFSHTAIFATKHIIVHSNLYLQEKEELNLGHFWLFASGLKSCLCLFNKIGRYENHSLLAVLTPRDLQFNT